MINDLKALEQLQKDIKRKEINLDTHNNVVMANRMVLYTASNLSLDEIKLLRCLIMQVEVDDKEFYEFKIPANDFANVLGIDKKDLYKRLDVMTTHIMQEVIRIADDKKERYKKFNWVDTCEYAEGIMTIKLHDNLKPFLLDLKASFTKYELAEIIKLNSIYGIRLYEIIRSYMDDYNLPYADHKSEISISMEVLRKATSTETKFTRHYDFKKKVIDVAVKEINRCSKYHITAEPYKSGRNVLGYDFIIESQTGYLHRQHEELEKDNEQIQGQLSIFDDELKEYGIADK